MGLELPILPEIIITQNSASEATNSLLLTAYAN